MKNTGNKFLLFFSIVAGFLLVIFITNCSKSSPASPVSTGTSATGTSTPVMNGTATEVLTATATATNTVFYTETATVTPTFTSTALPSISSDVYITSDSGSISYQARVMENGSEVDTAQVQIDDLGDANPPVQMPYNASYGDYVNSSPATYVPGNNYEIQIVTYDGRTFTAQVDNVPGGITIAGDGSSATWTVAGDSGVSFEYIYSSDYSKTYYTDDSAISPYTFTFVYQTGSSYAVLVNQQRQPYITMSGTGGYTAQCSVQVYQTARLNLTK